jgi:nucleotide-binding universal stress UspA family protein
MQGQGSQASIDRPIVVGTDGTPRARAAVREAAELAMLEGVTLHIVAAYVVADDVEHRMSRVHAPRDVAHDISGRGDAFADAHEARLMVERPGLEVRVHVAKGTLPFAVRWVALQVGGAMVVPEKARAGRFARLRTRQAAPSTDVPVIAIGERLAGF